MVFLIHDEESGANSNFLDVKFFSPGGDLRISAATPNSDEKFRTNRFLCPSSSSFLDGFRKTLGIFKSFAPPGRSYFRCIFGCGESVPMGVHVTRGGVMPSVIDVFVSTTCLERSLQAHS